MGELPCPVEYCDQSGEIDEGTALIEGAVILPVLFILVFGVFEFSWLIFQQALDLDRHRRCGALYCKVGESPTTQRSNKMRNI